MSTSDKRKLELQKNNDKLQKKRQTFSASKSPTSAEEPGQAAEKAWCLIYSYKTSTRHRRSHFL